MNIRHQLRTWGAERFDRIQYPRLRQIAPEPKFKVPPSTALMWLVVGIFATVIPIAILLFIAFFVLPAFS